MLAQSGRDVLNVHNIHNKTRHTHYNEYAAGHSSPTFEHFAHTQNNNITFLLLDIMARVTQDDTSYSNEWRDNECVCLQRCQAPPLHFSAARVSATLAQSAEGKQATE